MNNPKDNSLEGPARHQPRPAFHGWLNVIIASVAMTATLPGRTHGLGLVTEPLLIDLDIDSVLFARINLAGTLIGAAFCLPVGRLIDRFGVRSVLAAVTLALGISVVAMSASLGAISLLLGIILTRGFGQSALSVVSIAVISKWFTHRLGLAMGVFAVLLTFGFIGSVLGMGAAVERWGWRTSWLSLGLIVIGLAPLFWSLTKNAPQGGAASQDAPGAAAVKATDDDVLIEDWTFRQSLWTPSFWIVALGCGAFNFVWSGITLFNESLLAERGLDKNMAVQIMAILTGVGLVANLACAPFATRGRILKLLGAGLIVLAIGLAIFPVVDGPIGARIYAVMIGLSGGIVTVVFFAAWGRLYGRMELGRIQGAAQLATVLASALGPVAMAEGRVWIGSYSPLFWCMAGVVGLMGAAAMITGVPQKQID